jgi:methylenetetrahydrofolate reductase (NADPH)
MAEAGIREIFAVGGDSPEPAGPYRSAMEMLVALGEMGRSFDEVGIAGYPERHPLVEDRELLRALLDKQPFATYLVSQICFDPRSVFEWMGRIRRAGFRLPVHIGMPGAVSRVRLLEISFRIGVGESVRYLKKSGSLVSRLVRRSSFRPDAFLAGVAAQLERGAENVVGFHINTFNQVDRTERWRTEALARFGSGPQPAAESSP